jgi:exopolyphosphatase/pppGpp-phosphohydrolase
MQPSIHGISPLIATFARARQLVPMDQPIVVLHLGDEQAMLAWGTEVQPSKFLTLPIGLSGLANKISPNGQLSELAMEQIIAEVEDTVMPLHTKLPAASTLFSDDAMMAELSRWACRTDNTTHWQLDIDSVEHLFNRLVALAQGRPASQDSLPTTGRFAATLLVLREWLHHLHFDGITVLGSN